MENGKAELIIDKMRSDLEAAQTVPLSSGKIMVNKEDFLLMLDELEDLIDFELKNFREITDKRAKIINDAKKQAENILYEAEKSASRIRVTKRIGGEVPAFRQSELSRSEKMALRTANDIYAASLIYTDEMLTEVDNLFSDAYRTIEEECRRMVTGLKSKLDKISENREELTESLNELSKSDRYGQILEISQLLANELYHEREKAREREKEKNYQLEFKFDEVTEENIKPKIEINPDRTPIKIDTGKKKESPIPVSAKNNKKASDKPSDEGDAIVSDVTGSDDKSKTSDYYVEAGAPDKLNSDTLNSDEEASESIDLTASALNTLDRLDATEIAK